MENLLLKKENQKVLNQNKLHHISRVCLSDGSGILFAFSQKDTANSAAEGKAIKKHLKPKFFIPL